MDGRYLITTADQRSWKRDRPVLFLGNWCKRYAKRNDWEPFDSITVPYHWNDRQLLYQDYLYLQSFNEIVLQELATAFNNIHGVNHSLRYWRIVLGPWLGYFIQMVFDRWQMIQKAVNEFEINGTTIVDFTPESMVPQNMVDFIQLFKGDLWNHWIYKVILQEHTDIPCSIVKTQNGVEKKQNTHWRLRPILGKTVRSVLGGLSQLIAQKNEYFFIASYLGKAQSQLEVKLGQFPATWHSPSLSKFPVNWKLRAKLDQLANSHNNSFEKFILSLIPRQIPITYLEGYADLTNKIKTVAWPEEPGLIFTANAYNSNDFFKAWAAQKVENGTKLVIGQHGGLVGTAKWNFLEEHEALIADRYLSWGWTKQGSTKVTPLSAGILLKNSKIRPDPKGGVLLVTGIPPRYSYFMYSAPVVSQFEEYFEDQFRFAEILAPEVSQQLNVRLYLHDYGWDQKLRWQDRLSHVQFDSMKRSMLKSLRKNRLFVGTYNATTFLETFFANYPTIIFWNPRHWELRPSAQPYFDKLRHVGILHDTAESAATKVNEIFADPLEWWQKPEIQTAKDYFCNKFAKSSKNALGEWCNELRNQF